MNVLERLKDKYGDMTSACDALGISMRTVQKWKKGETRISRESAKLIADDLGLSIRTVVISIHGKREK